MILSATENNPELMSPQNIAQTMIYMAESFLEQKDYAKAESYFRKALDLRKCHSKQRGIGGNASKELASETGMLAW